MEPLATVSPDRSNVLWSYAMYLLPFLFYGPLAALILVPFGLPANHWAYYVFYFAGAMATVILIHRGMAEMLNGCYFSIDVESIVLGREPKSVVRVSDIEKAVPVAYRHRPFRRPIAEPATLQRFNLLLLVMKDGSRLALVHVANLRGFDRFLGALIDTVRPMLRELSPLEIQDIEAMKPSKTNKLQIPAAT